MKKALLLFSIIMASIIITACDTDTDLVDKNAELAFYGRHETRPESGSISYSFFEFSKNGTYIRGQNSNGTDVTLETGTFWGREGGISVNPQGSGATSYFIIMTGDHFNYSQIKYYKKQG